MSETRHDLMEQISNYLLECHYGEAISLSYGEFEVSIQTVLSELEKKAFINRVVDSSFVNDVEYSSYDSKLAFIATFAQMLTDLPIPTRDDDPETTDLDKLYAIFDCLNLVEQARNTSDQLDSLVDELKSCIDKEVNFRLQKLVALYGMSSASSEAIETFSTLMHKGAQLVDTAIDQLDKNGNKIFKLLTKEKVSEWLNGIQSTVANSLLSKEDNILHLNKEGDA